MPPTTPPTQPTPPERDKVAEWIIPINRSGWAVAAGYVALFSFPFVIPGVVALILGIIALVDLKRKPNRRGYGRAIFAIVYGGLVTLLVGIFLLVPLLNR